MYQKIYKMKKILFFLSFAFLFMACSTTKVVRSSQKGLKGNWVLSSITTNHGNLVDIKSLFNQASPECFEGSQWSFVSNNNSGTYTFQNGNCSSDVSSIKWFLEEDANGQVSFLWKFIPDGVKAKDIKAGYELKLISESDTEFSLAQDAFVEGEAVVINYYFTKN